MAAERFSVISFRSAEEEEETLRLFKEHGLSGLNVPLIVIKTVEIDETKSFFRKLGGYDYLIFNSVHAFYSSLKLMIDLEVELGDFPNLKIACVGEKTAAKALEFIGDKIPMEEELLIPDKFSADGLVELFGKVGIKGKRVLLPVSNLSNESFVTKLQSLGAEVDRVVVYRNEPPKEEDFPQIREKITASGAKFYLFTSPSTFKNFMLVMGEGGAGIFKKTKTNFTAEGEGIVADGENSETPVKRKICAIGDVTKKAIEEAGFQVDIMPEKFTMENLLHLVKSEI
ncbi:MAG: uroporphyrinogen-III synthase [Ignavibacteriales bacterium]|nr:MAG: uroporphyrinogen-III synthase [Ignavibacteriaceae bacterium]MBW7871983.1 uroporphyrinogen-III synthase [Ignavibacteria bacterium]MCZ2144359.1 uroporphyrinogen-III synthase [Ignavibacteriales bacterium]OQY72608.1 MAG: hypothetical protein B6D45_08935 [Ignavibacteriales bacterium UTCHB3]MBV6446121.1 hypothetical protein [Ignavibacteriaceae bacterium]